MSTVAPAAPAAPATQAPTEESLDQQLEALFGTKSDAPPASDKPVDPAAAKDPAASPDPAADPLETALKEIEESGKEGKEDDPKPATLTDDQEAVLSVIPTPQVARRMFEVAQGYERFTGAFTHGNFEAIDSELSRWSPDQFQAYEEHLYQKYMVNGDWAQRFIDEAEGRRGQSLEVKALNKKIAALEERNRTKDDGDAQTRQNAEQARTAAAYENYLTGLFDKIGTPAGDRNWIMSQIHLRVGADQKIMDAVRKGHLSAVNDIFAKSVREFNSREKATQDAKDAKIAEQSKKKDIMTSSAGTTSQEGELPSDIKQVPKGQEDNWMVQELKKLFAGNKKK